MTVRVEVLSWVNKLVGGPGTGEVTVEAPAPRGRASGTSSGSFPTGTPSWDGPSGIRRAPTSSATTSRSS